MTTSTETHIREHEADLVVEQAEVAADGVLALTLAAPGGEPLPAWTPGAHIDLLIGPGLIRQYSLCGSPSDPRRWRIGVLREPASRGGSAYVHDQLRAGARIRVRGPRNHFPLIAAPGYVFIAGGIGITPLLPMLAEAQAAGADWRLLYGGRSRASMAFAAELKEYGGKVTLVPQDEAGIPDLDAVIGAPRPGTLVYCCGPEGLLGAVEQRCKAWPAGALHTERFAPKQAAPAPGGDTEFEIVLQRSGLTLTVDAGTSVFDTVRAAGVSVLGSCLEGICGTCETGVLDGEVDHRDSVLSEEEKEDNEVMMICVSRCRSGRLTLDL